MAPTNSEIASAFNELAGLMELHGENSFKINSYKNAYRFLRKIGDPLSEMTEMEIAGIRGVGEAIAGKIKELVTTGKMETLEKWRNQTPEGIRQMLKVKGFGPKKIGIIWEKMGIENIGELLYACDENRLVELKGFGAKSQASLKEQLEYFMQGKDSYHFAKIFPIAENLIEQLYELYPDERHELTGEIRRLCPVLDQIDILTSAEAPYDFADGEQILLESEGDDYWELKTPAGLEIRLHLCEPDDFGTRLFQTTASPEFLEAFEAKFGDIDLPDVEEESIIFENYNLPIIAPELREVVIVNSGLKPTGERALEGWSPELIKESDIKGVIHSHTTYSDGINSIREMVERSISLGYSYLGLTDHSKAAFYADGLSIEKVQQQWKEIDEIQSDYDNFRIFKGIESDILSDGSLDYPDEILAGFDFIIASVHSNLKMPLEKATKRLITAIENPYTTMLGHPTGRLLLSRKGYPIDYKKVIDACSSNAVAIEINANPNRLDLDWTWVPYALHKGVKLSINPDAHSLGGIQDIKWGTLAARKGGLEAKDCLCCLSSENFLLYCKSKQI